MVENKIKKLLIINQCRLVKKDINTMIEAAVIPPIDTAAANEALFYKTSVVIFHN